MSSSNNNSTLQQLLSFTGPAAPYLADTIKNAIAYGALQASGILDMLMADSDNVLLGNLKIGAAFTGSSEAVRLVNGNTTIINGKNDLIRAIDTLGYNALAMLMVTQFNFDSIALDMLNNLKLPLSPSQMTNLLAGVLLTAVSLLRRIIQLRPEFSSLRMLANPVLYVSQSIPMTGSTL